MSLIETYLPDYQFAEHHQISVAAYPATVMAAAAGYDPGDDGLFRFLIGIREMPMRLRNRISRKQTAMHAPFGLGDFLPLGRDGDSEIAYGLVGRFWQSDFGLVALRDAAAFQAFSEPKVAKLVLNFSAREEGGQTLLSTQTRVHCSDRPARLRFMPYWYAIRLPSGYIRRRMLSTIKHNAESRATP